MNGCAWEQFPTAKTSTTRQTNRRGTQRRAIFPTLKWTEHSFTHYVKSFTLGRPVVPFHPAVSRIASSKYCLVGGINSEPRRGVEYVLDVYVAKSQENSVIHLFFQKSEAAINDRLICKA